eukprot:TRINITY_DN6536_c1_g2_i1.p1 TRINITY_DN6536_c1_g2~~TRINITY_DN6536_c1_g2_i1.p1  ORF type:complete len:180 (+),score=6.56 TRINITY_DN6536_c1_g2_i1:352-891(+)
MITLKNFNYHKTSQPQHQQKTKTKPNTKYKHTKQSKVTLQNNQITEKITHKNIIYKQQNSHVKKPQTVLSNYQNSCKLNNVKKQIPQKKPQKGQKYIQKQRGKTTLKNTALWLIKASHLFYVLVPQVFYSFLKRNINIDHKLPQSQKYCRSQNFRDQNFCVLQGYKIIAKNIFATPLVF